ncbi:MAG: DNA translocase FtsK [bacterium]|nr:DNA translocase FtsK [bacterium]
MATRRTTKKKVNKAEPVLKNKIKKIIIIFFSLIIFLALISHHSSDFAIINGGKNGQIQNWIGLVGACISQILLLLFGLGSYIFSLYFITLSVQSFSPTPYYKRKGFCLSVISFILGVTILMAMWPESFVSITNYLGIGSYNSPGSALSGGVIGQFLASPITPYVSPGFIRKYMGSVGTCILGIALVGAGTVYLWKIENFLILKKILSILKPKKNIEKKISKRDLSNIDHDFDIDLTRKKIKEKRNKEREKEEKNNLKNEQAELKNDSSFETLIPSTIDKNIGKKKSKQSRSNGFYKLPGINLLRDIAESAGDSADIIKISKGILQDTLNSFGIDAKVTEITTGPRVTRFEIVPAPGIRVQKISNLEYNIKMDLKAESIRILAPIPGRDTVGIEVPNKKSSAVCYKGILQSRIWRKNSQDIPIVLGKDVSGEPVITDLSKAPHLLIAGATGSGKSVCVNTLIMSLLYKFTPDDLRLIMVDPKVVEFEMYQNLPHLITPIVNDPKKVPCALRWAVNEMENRYKTLAKARVKNLSGYNTRELPKEPVLDDDNNPLPEKLPFIIIIIDELADIMMVAKADVETSIARIAQKARAVGIHLVLATQRPSKEIITGIIKANLPTRIAFRVASIVDSRVILDHKGAETLLGKGDMLFIPPGSAKLERIQGAMLFDSEIDDVVNYCASQVDQKFDAKVTSNDNDKLTSGQGNDLLIEDSDNNVGNDMIQQAIEIIKRERKASTSYLQRRLKIGYNRAAEIIDALEDQGIIGPQIGSSRREIFISKDSN